MYREYCEKVLMNNIYSDLFMDYPVTVKNCLYFWDNDNRLYHNIKNHLYPMLKQIELFDDWKSIQDIFNLAALFHDVIYVPGHLTNEIESIKHLKSYINPDNINNPIINEIINMIKGTIISISIDRTDFAKNFFILDILPLIDDDINIGIALNNTLLVREEFKHIGPEKFIKGNNNIMDYILNFKFVNDKYPNAKKRIDVII